MGDIYTYYIYIPKSCNFQLMDSLSLFFFYLLAEAVKIERRLGVR